MKKHTKKALCVAVIVMILGSFCLPVFTLPVQAVEDSEIELIKVALTHLSEDISELKTENQALKEALNAHIQNDVSISKIEKTATNGNVDTYTITMSDGTTYNFTVTNGQDGTDGTDGVCISKIEKTATNGNKDTYTILMTNGTTYNFTITNGQDGSDGKDGVDGQDGSDGKDGVDGADGQDGADGKDGVDGEDGLDGADAESSSSQTASTDGLSSSMGIIAIVIACISLIGNIVMVIYICKNKKI